MLYYALLKSSPILNVTSEQGNKSKSSQKKNRMQLFCITDIVFQFPFAKTIARTPANLRLIQIKYSIQNCPINLCHNFVYKTHKNQTVFL